MLYAMPSFGDWGQITGASFTAVTAFYAARSVQQGQRLWRTNAEPDLHPQILRDLSNRSTSLAVFNAGGMAKGVTFAMGCQGMRTAGHISDGFMPPGTKAHVESALPWDDETGRCLLLYRGLDESSYATANGEPRRQLRQGRKKVRVTSIGAEWDRLYPDAPWESLRGVESVVRDLSRL